MISFKCLQDTHHQCDGHRRGGKTCGCRCHFGDGHTAIGPPVNTKYEGGHLAKIDGHLVLVPATGGHE